MAGERAARRTINKVNACSSGVADPVLASASPSSFLLPPLYLFSAFEARHLQQSKVPEKYSTQVPHLSLIS